MVVIALLIGVGAYRKGSHDMWHEILKQTDASGFVMSYAIAPHLMVVITASLASALCIIVMDRIYSKVLSFIEPIMSILYKMHYNSGSLCLDTDGILSHRSPL